MSESLRVVVKVVARTDAIAGVKSIVLTLAEKSRAENGCAAYEVLQDLSAPEVFLLVEEWDSVAALEAHNKTAHFHEAVAKSASLLGKPLDVGRYRVIGEEST
jgi:quinol monooxygenase YgiN